MQARKDIIGYIFVTPAILFFIVFTILPLLLSVFLGFYKSNIFFDNMEWMGLENFKRVFSDDVFLKSLLNICLYVLMAVPLNIVISLCLAMLLNGEKKGVKVFRVLFYMPSVTSAVAASLVWGFLMQPNYGLFNQILTGFGLRPFTWLSNSSTALFSVTIITVWMGLGGNMIILLAALQNLPTDIFEAAQLDGAGKAKIFFKITLAYLAPTLFFITTMTLIGAFQLYDQVKVLTGGGPANSTMTPVFNIWQNAFGNTANQAGYAAAQSFVLFAIIFVVSLGVRRLNREIDK